MEWLVIAEVVLGGLCSLLCLVGRLFLAHPVSRRWNPDWDWFFLDGPFYLAVFLALGLGALGQVAFLTGFLLGTVPLWLLRLRGRRLPENYHEPLPPLPKKALEDHADARD